mmetsp:Transcript_23544/g.41659  ORF Transcript_23544/g.41659 Transcript_23544/m.41659 type:complete len:786 (+) Transcript_23544:140-2497(+)|eukprot:CAMPEP_0197534800 /NCGR_PEP_ID=MMETSP1318-20131121/48385_1 /TAXON_ID=552666 /ORGANISM="Partenskyella glossopodia, Strain RCC365" /LENGTH=785 /DNA_ID=CAMNT_0043092193 /DNA_START=110 /DNA_END=2467 /DNA_ORIENTATION=+
MLKTLYLVLFNLASAAGWAYCGLIISKHLQEAFEPSGPQNLWSELEEVLLVTQSLAFMEIVHSVIGMTRSPVIQTTLQVTSRIIPLWLNLRVSKGAQSDWSLFLMVSSWTLVEVPRYVFYVFKQFGDKYVPSPLFHLRYSLFYVLYPTGITGEVLNILASLPKAIKTDMWANFPMPPNACSPACSMVENLLGCHLTFALLYAYLFLALPQIFMMHLTRKHAYKKKYPRKPKDDKANGIIFPLIDGQRSTQDAGRATVCAAISGGSQVVDKRAAKARLERNWRFKYVRHFKAMVEASLESPEKAKDIAQAGSDFMHNTFQFRRESGEIVSLSEEMERKDTCFKGVGVIEGSGVAAKQLSVPYKKRDESNPLVGEEICRLADKWANYGTIEADAADAIKMVVNNPKWIENLKNHYFVLIGAGSAMGPFLKLMELGANIIALDIPGAWERPKRPSIWRKLIKVARASGGKMIFPLTKPQKECRTDDQLVAAAGGNLMTQVADIKNWLLRLPQLKDTKNKVTIGNYTYLNGGLHVKLSLCADAIMKSVIAARGTKSTSLAFLCTPTDMHVITEDANKATVSNSQECLCKPIGAVVESLMSTLSGGKWLRSNVWTDKASKTPLVDGLVVAQGPNYAIAKRLQHWRAMLAYEEGVTVSSNIAPSTATKSVVSATTFKWAYGGIPYFKPYEIFDQETTNAVMTAMLVHDLSNPNAPANPNNRQKEGSVVENPMELFKYGSVHGGVWRSPYKMDSLGVVSVLIYFMGGPSAFIPVVVTLVGALSGTVYSMAFM